MIKRGAVMKNNKGQALIETLLTTVTLTIIVFAALQLVMIAVNELIVNEAVFAIARVAVVSRRNEVSSKTSLAAAYLFAQNNLQIIPCSVPVEADEIDGPHVAGGSNCSRVEIVPVLTISKGYVWISF